MPAESDKIIREKIAGLDSLPAGIVFNSNAGWQKTEQILQPAKKRKFTWYYAAAMVLVVGSAELLFHADHTSSLAPYTVQKITVADKYTTNGIHTIAVAKKITPAPIPARSVSIASHTNETVNVSAAVIPNENNTNIQPTIPVTEGPQNLITVKPVVLIAHKDPVKPTRLKVVHLNELGLETEMIYTRSPLKKMQVIDELPDEQPATQLNKAWWQPKPKPVTTITDHP